MGLPKNISRSNKQGHDADAVEELEMGWVQVYGGLSAWSDFDEKKNCFIKDDEWIKEWIELWWYSSFQSERKQANAWILGV